MVVTLNVDKADPPMDALVVANIVRSSLGVSVTWSNKTLLELPEVAIDTSANICRFLARSCPESKLYGDEVLHRTEVDHWVSFSCTSLASNKDFHISVEYLNQMLAPTTYLVGNALSLADISVWSVLFKSRNWQRMFETNEVPANVARWFKFVSSLDPITTLLSSLPEGVTLGAVQADDQKNKADGSKTKDEGKFVELPGAIKGHVIVRFPPEASGYLHIGHAKAALLNEYYKEAYEGKLIMRFDDTNPAKEKKDFEKVILEDLTLLKIKPDKYTHTSNYFELMLEFCEKLLYQGSAYVDDTDAETMKQEREQRMESKNRNNSVAKNMTLWSEMKSGSELGQKCCVRAKIDMDSTNGCMRDPTIYRCKNEPHPRTGTKYRVYPTYDFACPIVDSVEGVTHCLRTMEYHDRDEQFFWFIDVLGLRKPCIWEYSRLNMMNTVLSKRKLTWFVDEGLVDGWDDPRFPTVRGVMRRGMTVDGLKQFIVAQGSSRSVVIMEWDKIWAFNKKVIDPIAPRYTSIAKDNVPVLVKSVTAKPIEVPKHPKDNNIGMKTIWIGPRILIDREDADTLKEGENATFINWGNLLVEKINKENGKITSVEVSPNLENTDYKKTVKLTWLAQTKKAPFVPCVCVYFDHIISKAILSKDEDFKNFVNRNTRKEVRMLGDPELLKVKKSDIIQLQRRGFFICDTEYGPASLHSGKDTPMVLFYIPDGRAKEMATSGAPKGSPVPSGRDSSAVSPSIDESVARILAPAITPVISPNKPITTGVDPVDLNQRILAQGDVVRKLKSEKASKESVSKEVSDLLKLKADFKAVTGIDWKPGVQIPSALSTGTSHESNASPTVVKSEPTGTSQESNSPIEAKSEPTGTSQESNASPTAVESGPAELISPKVLCDQIVQQEDKVRQLKSEKAVKEIIAKEVNVLLKLKADFLDATGIDWNSGVEEQPEPSPEFSPESRCQVLYESAGPITPEVLRNLIVQQEDRVRLSCAKINPKIIIYEEVEVLLALKSKFKEVTGLDWKWGMSLPSAIAMTPIASEMDQSSNMIEDLNKQIAEQDAKVRDLKAQNAQKDVMDSEVKTLVHLKSEFKRKSGSDWKPQHVAPHVSLPKEQTPSAKTLVYKGLIGDIMTQACKVQNLKSENAPDPILSMETKKLSNLQNEYESITKQKWDDDSDAAQAFSDIVAAQGQHVRQMKSSNADSALLEVQIKNLLKLKDDYKLLTGEDYSPSGPASTKRKSEKKKVSSQKTKEKPASGSKKADDKKQTRLGLEATKEDNLPEWYSQVITKGELIEYYDVSGCYIFRPWAFAIWEFIKDFLDREIKKFGVQNCYFPLFVSRSVLEKEKTHIADFAPEVAWVTKSGDSELAEPIAVRPTSETVMYPAYAKWVQSYRDLPVKLNQWNNVVRWEFKHPQPFLRTREFLWQEGHTAYGSKEEAEAEVLDILNLYAAVYEDLLAIPVIRGRKTEKEKFAGGEYTTTVEAFISASGRAIQGATSHHLGQNFSKMFDISYEDPETKEKKFVFQNSWGLTTRTIGVMIMVHADNQGLVLPPRVASIQVVIVPCGITVNTKDEERATLQDACVDLENEIKRAGLRVLGDYRDNYSPGWRYNHWELKGVPIRVELGPKDFAKKQIVAVRRDTGEKITLPRKNAVQDLSNLLDTIQKHLLASAQNDLALHTRIIHNWEEFCKELDEKNIILSPFCGEVLCEDQIKKESARDDADAEPGAPAMGAKSLCNPFAQPYSITSFDKCINPSCQNKPKQYTLFGRSY